MKKLFVAVLAIAGLVACNNEETVLVQGPAPIAFDGSFVETRANVAGDPSTTTANIETFNVWGFMDEPSGKVFVEEEVNKNGGEWSYVNTQYWAPGHKYYFAALANYDNAVVNTDGANLLGLGNIKFTVTDGSDDLLYSAVGPIDAPAQGATYAEKVKFEFNHMLSKVKFTFTNGLTNELATIDVKNIQMTVPATADIDVNVADWWSTNCWENYTGTVDVPFGDACAKTGIGESQECDDARIILPANDDVVYTVTFDVVLYQGDVVAYEGTKTVEIKGVALQIGKSYNFTAELNASNITADGSELLPIEFEVIEVKDWVEETINGGAVEDELIVLNEVVTSADEMAAALKSDANIINVKMANDIVLPISSLGQMTGGSGEYKLGGEKTVSITIDLNGNKLSVDTTYWSNLGAKNDNALFTIKNGTMTSSQPTGTWNSYDLTFSNCDYVFENVTFEKAIAFDNAGKSVSLKDVTINETHDYYAMWITATGQNVTIDGLTVESAGRGIKIDEQYVDAPAKVTLNIANSTFTTANKAAILVKSVAGAEINVENIDITNVAKDTKFAVWVDEDAAAYADKVVVNGALVKVEGATTQAIATDTELREALKNGDDVILTEDITTTDADSNGNGATGININGGVFDGNGHTIAVEGATGTWDSAIAITSGTIKNVTVAKGFRGIFFKNGTEKIVLENVIISGPVYTISCDSAGKQGFEAYNSKFYGWTSYAATIGTGYFEGCTFGEGSGYNFSRPYAPTTYVNCDFEAGHKIDARGIITFENCRVNGVALTSENLGTLVSSNTQNATVIK